MKTENIIDNILLFFHNKFKGENFNINNFKTNLTIKEIKKRNKIIEEIENKCPYKLIRINSLAANGPIEQNVLRDEWIEKKLLENKEYREIETKEQEYINYLKQKRSNYICEQNTTKNKK